MAHCEGRFGTVQAGKSSGAGHSSSLTEQMRNAMIEADAEVLVVYAATATDAAGVRHTARACARERERGRWEVWFELEPETGGRRVRTSIETTQPDREAAARWACGISRVYLEGALARASESDPAREASVEPDLATVEEREAVLDPSEVMAGGEQHLRSRLDALSTSHLRDVAREQRALSSLALESSTKEELVEAIIAQARPGA